MFPIRSSRRSFRARNSTGKCTGLFPEKRLFAHVLGTGPEEAAFIWKAGETFGPGSERRHCKNCKSKICKRKRISETVSFQGILFSGYPVRLFWLFEIFPGSFCTLFPADCFLVQPPVSYRLSDCFFLQTVSNRPFKSSFFHGLHAMPSMNLPGECPGFPPEKRMISHSLDTGQFQWRVENRRLF